MDVTLTFGGADFSSVLSTYHVTHETEYGKVITTLDHTEHAAPAVYRPVISFSLFPMTDAQATAYYAALRQSIGNATYTDSFAGDAQNQYQRTAQFRVVSNLDAVFGLRSCDGNRYWKGGEIQLRATQTIQ